MGKKLKPMAKLSLYDVRSVCVCAQCTIYGNIIHKMTTRSGEAEKVK